MSVLATKDAMTISCYSFQSQAGQSRYDSQRIRKVHIQSFPSPVSFLATGFLLKRKLHSVHIRGHQLTLRPLWGCSLGSLHQRSVLRLLPHEARPKLWHCESCRATRALFRSKAFFAKHVNSKLLYICAQSLTMPDINTNLYMYHTFF